MKIKLILALAVIVITLSLFGGAFAINVGHDLREVNWTGTISGNVSTSSSSTVSASGILAQDWLCLGSGASRVCKSPSEFAVMGGAAGDSSWQATTGGIYSMENVGIGLSLRAGLSVDGKVRVLGLALGSWLRPNWGDFKCNPGEYIQSLDLGAGTVNCGQLPAIPAIPSGCTNDCPALNAKKCNGVATYLSCGNSDSDECFEWGTTTLSCAANEICSGGKCVSSALVGGGCTNECNPGEKRCSTDASYENCVIGSNGCYKWDVANAVDCPIDYPKCDSGKCARGVWNWDCEISDIECPPVNPHNCWQNLGSSYGYSYSPHNVYLNFSLNRYEVDGKLLTSLNGRISPVYRESCNGYKNGEFMLVGQITSHNCGQDSYFTSGDLYSCVYQYQP